MKVVINPPNALWRLLSEKHWDAAISMLDMDQNFRAQAAKKLSASNCPGSLCPLHYSLLEDAPERLILSLLKAYPEAAMYHYNHDTPLHLAIKQKQSLSIIKALSLAYPESFQQTRNGKDLESLIRKCYKHDCIRERDVLCYFEGIVASSDISLLNDSNIVIAGPANKEKESILPDYTEDTVQTLTDSMFEIKATQCVLLENQQRIEGALLELAQSVMDMKVPSLDFKDSVQTDLNHLKREMQADIRELELRIYDIQSSSPVKGDENKNEDDKTDAETNDSLSFVNIS